MKMSALSLLVLTGLLCFPLTAGARICMRGSARYVKVIPMPGEALRFESCDDDLQTCQLLGSKPSYSLNELRETRASKYLEGGAREAGIIAGVSAAVFGGWRLGTRSFAKDVAKGLASETTGAETFANLLRTSFGFRSLTATEVAGFADARLYGFGYTVSSIVSGDSMSPFPALKEGHALAEKYLAATGDACVYLDWFDTVDIKNMFDYGDRLEGVLSETAGRKPRNLPASAYESAVKSKVVPEAGDVTDPMTGMSMSAGAGN